MLTAVATMQESLLSALAVAILILVWVAFELVHREELIVEWESKEFAIKLLREVRMLRWRSGLGIQRIPRTQETKGSVRVD